MLRDLGERERAEAVTRWQARLLDLSREAILAWELGGAIVYWNAGAEALYGFPREEALGRVSHELLRTVHPIDPAAFEAALAEAGHWVGELVHATRDGREVVVAFPATARATNRRLAIRWTISPARSRP